MMIKSLNKKKGELSTQQIITIIILITSFIVVLFFLFRLNLGKETEAEICRNSVVTRGSSVVPSDASPLQCSRTYVCLTEDGSCEGQINSEVKKVESESQVYEALSENMAECWWKFGAGQVDYIGKDFFVKDNYCSVCSQILFDDSLSEIQGFENRVISKDKLHNYMTENNYSKDVTYSEYIFGTNSLDVLKSHVSENQGLAATFGNIEIGKNQYYTIMGITSEVAGRGWKIAAGVSVGVVGLFAGYTWPGLIAGVVVIAGGEVSGQINPEIAAIPVEGRGIPNTFMAPTIQEIDSEQIKALNCEEIITLS